MENNNQQNRKFLLLIIPGFIFVALVVIILYFANSKAKLSQPSPVVFPTPVPLLYKSTEIKSIIPNYSHALISGKVANFTITFNRSVLNQQINILLQKKHLGASDDTVISVPLSQVVQGNGTQIVVSTLSPIEPLNEYSLIVTDKGNTSLLSATYSSSTVVISPVPSNNPELKQYLPYETSTYKLSYNKQNNIYVFNFKIDPNSQTPILEQFNQAKQQAEDFIKSKGIDINSIVIDWRHS